jgi:FixJ family two-component response regulator
VSTFKSTQEFLAFPKHDVPSCLILDVRLRGESGLTFREQVAKSGLLMPIVFMTWHGDIAMSVKAISSSGRAVKTPCLLCESLAEQAVMAPGADNPF